MKEQQEQHELQQPVAVVKINNTALNDERTRNLPEIPLKGITVVTGSDNNDHVKDDVANSDNNCIVCDIEDQHS